MGNNTSSISNSKDNSSEEIGPFSADTTAVVLTNKNLDVVPPDVFRVCSGAQTLNLSRNQLKSLPDRFRELPQLASFFANANALTELPASFSCLSKLSICSVQRNRLSQFPTPVLALGSLVELELQENQLHRVPPEIGQLTSLKHLNLNGNAVTCLPETIANLTGLVSLNCRDNKLQSVPHLGKMPNLRYLVLSNNQIKSILGCCELPELENCYLDHNLLDSMPEEVVRLCKLSSLRVLELRMNPGLFVVPEVLHGLSSVHVDCPSPILDGRLFLGSMGSSENLLALKQVKISHILRVIDEETQPNAPHPNEGLTYMHIEAVDTDEQDLSQYFDEANKFLSAPGRVCLVYCRQGKSRSATMVCAHLIWSLKLSFDAAFELLRSRRAMVRPNPSFVKQLQDYARKLGYE